MSISVPPRGLAGSLTNRQARPMNGREVATAIENHILGLSIRLLDGQDILSDQISLLTDLLRQEIHKEFLKQSWSQKVNITYPKVGWSITARLEEIDGGVNQLNAEVELDLERNLRFNIRFGESGQGKVISSIEEEKIPTDVPDKDRQSFGLPVEAEYVRPDGTVGKVDLQELKSEKRAARTVDVGRAKVEGQEVSLGHEIKLPSELPEVTMEDLLATPPEPPKEPLKEPLPPVNSIAKVKRPDVKFKK